MPVVTPSRVCRDSIDSGARTEIVFGGCGTGCQCVGFDSRFCGGRRACSAEAAGDDGDGRY